jgi:hypothetical protein
MGFDFAVKYKPGTSNTVANALSRCSESDELAALSAPSFTVFDTIRVELDETAALHQLRAEVVAEGGGRQVAGGRRPHHQGWQDLCAGRLAAPPYDFVSRPRHGPRGCREDTTQATPRLLCAWCTVCNPGACLRLRRVPAQ